ncbi:MAG: hypothetical protein AAF969_15675 [Bacteroidota bacterium]
MKALFSLVFSLLVFSSLIGQKTWKHDRDTVRVSLKLGKASDNTFTKSQGAEVTGTFPANDTIDNSWLTNAYLELGLKTDSTGLEIGLVGELHRNTLIEKEQNVRQFGFNITKTFKTKDDRTNVSNEEFPTTLSLKSSEDLIKDTNTFQVILGASYNRFKGLSFLRTQTQFPRIDRGLGQFIGFSHNHNIGFTYLGRDENVFLGQFDFEFNTFLFPALSDTWIDKTDLFKLQFIYRGRTQMFGDTELDLDSYLSLQTGINLAFDKKNSIEVGYAWISGADPLKGLDNQDYQSLIVKVKVAVE